MHDPVTQTLTVSPVLPSNPIVLCDSAFLTTLSQVEREIAHIAVTDANTAQAASNLLQRLTTAGGKLDKARAALKAPFIEAGRQIDAAAREPQNRIEAAKTGIRQKVTAWQLEEQRKAREAEDARQKELARLEALRLKEEREAREKAEALRREAEERAAALKAPVLDVDFEEDAPPQKTETEIAIEAVKFAPAPVAAKPAGISFKVTLRIASVDVAKLPEPFVIKTPDQMKLRATFCTGWRDGDPVPVVDGVTFEVERTPVSTGRAVF